VHQFQSNAGNRPENKSAPDLPDNGFAEVAEKLVYFVGL
jgi:hypothetical protein